MKKKLISLCLLSLFILIGTSKAEDIKSWWIQKDSKLQFTWYPKVYNKVNLEKAVKPQEAVLLKWMVSFINNKYSWICEKNYYCLNIEIQKKLKLHKSYLNKSKEARIIKHYYYTTGYYELQEKILKNRIKKGDKEKYEKKIEESKIDYSNFLPKTFTIAEEISLILNWFKLLDQDDTKLDYRIDQNFWITTNLTLTNTKFDKVVASADKSLFSWGAEMNVYDKEGKKIGIIKENVFSSMFKVSTSYAIYNKDGNLIGSSSKFEFWVTKIEIKDKKWNIIFTLKRGMFNMFTDDWSAEKNKEKVIDDRIVVFLAAFKTISDQEAERKEQEEKRRNKSN